MKTITFEILSQREQLISTINDKQTNTKNLQYKILPAVRANKEMKSNILVTRHNQLELPASTRSDYFPTAEKYSTIPQNIYIAQYSDNSIAKIKEYTFLLALNGVSLSRIEGTLIQQSTFQSKG